jgi:hypothetical protein
MKRRNARASEEELDDPDSVRGSSGGGWGGDEPDSVRRSWRIGARRRLVGAVLAKPFSFLLAINF